MLLQAKAKPDMRQKKTIKINGIPNETRKFLGISFILHLNHLVQVKLQFDRYIIHIQPDRQPRNNSRMAEGNSHCLKITYMQRLRFTAPVIKSATRNVNNPFLLNASNTLLVDVSYTSSSSFELAAEGFYSAGKNSVSIAQKPRICVELKAAIQTKYGRFVNLLETLNDKPNL
jgi:hypothetical protein